MSKNLLRALCALALSLVPVVSVSPPVHAADNFFCAQLSETDRINAFRGYPGPASGFCVIGLGSVNQAPLKETNLDTLCAGQYNALVEYQIPNDPNTYYSTLTHSTCVPFVKHYIVRNVTRTRP
ncbi:hypothetical protein [Streptomyces venezuelae]|uniref:hypothetical protein n=1 Tax=Streptomyces venezuelae TaxID=54571 RepID=UPI003652F3F2